MKHKAESLTLVSARCAAVRLISGVLAEMEMREKYLEIERGQMKGFPSSFFLLSFLPSFLPMEVRRIQAKRGD